MPKRIIENGDVIFATGVKLRRDTTVNGGWVVTGFEHESFFNGLEVQEEMIDENKIEYYITDEEDV